MRGKCLVAWTAVCRPTIQGGLGVQNLKLVGYALQTRWLWLRRFDPDRAWAALPMKVEPQVQDLFDASIMVQVGSGRRSLFWQDNWLDGQSIADLAPALSALVNVRTRRCRTVAEALTDRQWVQDVTGVLSISALIEYLHLWDRLEEV